MALLSFAASTEPAGPRSSASRASPVTLACTDVWSLTTAPTRVSSPSSVTVAAAPTGISPAAAANARSALARSKLGRCCSGYTDSTARSSSARTTSPTPPCPGAGVKASMSSRPPRWLRSSSAIRAAAGMTMAPSSPDVTSGRRCSGVPVSSRVLRSALAAARNAASRSEKTPTTEPSGSSESVLARLATRALRASARLRTAAKVSSSGSVGGKVSSCTTATSIFEAESAASTASESSPPVRVLTVTCRSGHSSPRSSMTPRPWRTARVPSRLPSTILAMDSSLTEPLAVLAEPLARA